MWKVYEQTDVKNKSFNAIVCITKMWDIRAECICMIMNIKCKMHTVLKTKVPIIICCWFDTELNCLKNLAVYIN